jgi:REP element-mobilizing transposase RayT
MPDHVHILIQPTSHDVRMDLFLKALKAPFSRRIKRLLEAVGSPLLERLTVLERPGTHRFRFWQEGGGYDRNLRSVKAVEAAIAYIHENPASATLRKVGRLAMVQRPSLRTRRTRGKSTRSPSDDSRPELGLLRLAFACWSNK